MKQLVLCICLLILSACNIQTVEHYEEEQALIEKSVGQVEQVPTDEKVEHPIPSEPVEQSLIGDEESAPSEAQPVAQQQHEAEQEERIPSEPVEPKQDKPQEQAVSEPAAPQSMPQPSLSNEPAAPTQSEQRDTVTIAIEAKTLLDQEHYAMLKKPLQSDKYVPQDGVILPPTSYDIVQEGETVFHILQRAAREYDIHLEYEGADENMYNSVYIEGIHHLYEFSAGNLSGWIYDVNGVAPAKGASQYVVQPGDVITWHYTVDLGNDLGGVIRE